ncbi:MAG: hypothetical protein KatS3mg121_0812 [Gammaproteobacteria bacterium]|nr:MAG: hypothetical protein KatS3mg121_0812 [Gammaproteobacteria bacterium]
MRAELAAGLALLAALAPVRAEAPPDPALLEFLGEFSDETDRWIDPLWLERALGGEDREAPAREDGNDERESD